MKNFILILLLAASVYAAGQTQCNNPNYDTYSSDCVGTPSNANISMLRDSLTAIFPGSAAHARFGMDSYYTVDVNNVSLKAVRSSKQTTAQVSFVMANANGDLKPVSVATAIGALASSRSFGAATFSNSTTAIQLSTTRDAYVQYSYDATVTISLLAGQAVTATLQYADNSGMSTNLVSLDAQTTSNSGVLGLSQTNTLKVTGYIPAGKYRRVVFSTTGTGTTAPSAIKSSQEVLL